jgi:hypothetical protein
MMTRLMTSLVVGCAFLLAGPTAARAQARMPDAGVLAVGAEAGLWLPRAEFDPALVAGGLLEYYVTPRVSVRGTVTLASPQRDRNPQATVRHLRTGADVIYNFERGAWHPFLGGGLAVHSLVARTAGRRVDDRNVVGFALLGGTEYFFNRRTSLKFEGRLQPVDRQFYGRLTSFAATVGVKRYF